MKKLTIIIRPFKLDDLRDALIEADVSGMTITEVRGFGNQQGHTEIYTGAEYDIDFLPKIKVEIILNNLKVDNIISVILSTVQSGKVGDGKIFIENIENCIRIRTGETGTLAI